MYTTYDKVFGEPPNIFVLVISWKWKHFGVNYEQSINSSYNPITFCINTKKIFIFIFAKYQNYPLALRVEFGTEDCTI